MQNTDTIAKLLNRRSYGWWLSVVLLFVLAVCLTFYISYDKKQEMIDITLDWGRLAAFPVVKDKINIRSEGGSFSREFVGTFTASETVIREWIARSPGLQDAKIESQSENKNRGQSPIFCNICS